MNRAPRLAAAAEAIAEGALLVAPLVAILFLAPASGFGPEADRALALRALAVLAASCLAAATWARRATGPGGWRHLAPESRLALALLALGGLSTALAPDPLRSLVGDLPRLDGALALAANVALFLCARALTADPVRRRRLAGLLAGAGAIAAAHALAQAAGVDPLDWGRSWPGRPVGAQGNPVFLAGTLVILLPFAAAEVARCAAAGRRRAAALLAVAALAVAAALFASRGRGAVVGAAAGAVVFAAAGLAAAGRRSWARRLLVGAVLLGVTLAVLPAALGRPLPGLDPATGTARQRVLLWRATLELLASNPTRLAAGWGPESLALVLPRHLPEELPALVWEPGRSQDRAHNGALDLVVTLGVCGLALAAGLAALGLARPLARCGLGSGAASSRREIWLDAASAAALAGHLVEIQFGFRTAATGALAALVLGMATARRDEAPVGQAERPMSGALAGWLAGVALALLAHPFASAPQPSSGAAWVLGVAALAAAVVLGADLRPRVALGRAAPIALAALALGWIAAVWARRASAPGEAQAVAALLPVILGPLAIALVVARRPRERRRAGGALVLGTLGSLAALSAVLVWGTARPLAAGVAFGIGRAELERGDPDLAAAAFAVAASRVPALVDPARLEGRAAARIAAATRTADLRDRRFQAALATLDRAGRRHPLDPDLGSESALILARWSEFAPDPTLRIGRLKDARARLEAVVEVTPASAAAARNLAAVLLDLGEVAAARAAAERSSRLAPRSLESALLLGRARAASGDLDGALGAVRAAVRLDAARARRLLEGLARGAPSAFGAQVDLALLAVALGRPVEAAAAVENARRLAGRGDREALAALERVVATAGAGEGE